VRKRNGIVVVVSHRPSALAGVDTVLIMNQGRAFVCGPKDEVLPQVIRPAAQFTTAQQPAKTPSDSVSLAS
jgi:ATP-binding cassette subfamily C protein